MAKTYTQDNYHFKVNRGITKAGNNIYDDKDQSIFMLEKMPNKERGDILLSYVKTSIGREHAHNKTIKIDDDEFAKILILARKYVIETEQNLFVASNIQKTYDVQNYVVHGDNLYAPMSNEEILKLNDNGIIVQVKNPHIFYADYAFSTMYIVSSGKIDLDTNNALEGINKNTRCETKDNDFSNIVKLHNNATKIRKTDVIFYFDDNSKKAYKFPKNIEKDVYITLPLQLGYDKTKQHDAIIPEFDTEYEHIILRESYPYQLVKSMEDIVNHLKREFGDKDIPESNEDLKQIDRFLELNKTRPNLFYRDYRYDDIFEEIKNIRDTLSVKKTEYVQDLS